MSRLSLLVVLTIAYALGYAALYAANQGLAFWFQTLQRPIWTAPVVLFGPMWTIANGALGVAAWQVLGAEASERGGRKVLAISLAASTMVFVAVWSWCFFYWHLRLPAQLTGGFAVLAGIAAVVFAGRVRRSAGALALIYVLWTSYLVVLSLQVLLMNR
jgi:tryptophan-rich sensory protein